MESSILSEIETIRKKLNNLAINRNEKSNLNSNGTDKHSNVSTFNNYDERDAHVELLSIEIESLKDQVYALVQKDMDDRSICQQASEYASSKSVANAVLHAFFDNCMSAKVAVLTKWAESGVIPTRDGLRHWRLDPRRIRNEEGASLLHMACTVSMAKEKLKLKLVQFLIETFQFDVNLVDLHGRTPLHVACFSGYDLLVQSLINYGADPMKEDKAGMTPLSLVRTLSRPPEEIVKILTNYVKIDNVIKKSKTISYKENLIKALKLVELTKYVSKSHYEQVEKESKSILHRIINAKDSPVCFDYLLEETMNSLKTEELAGDVFSNESFKNENLSKEIRMEASRIGLDPVKLETSRIKYFKITWTSFIRFLLKKLQDYTNDKAMNIFHTSIQHEKYTRQAWYYSVLYKAATHQLPGSVLVSKGKQEITATENISSYFPMVDRLTIGSEEYFPISYNTEDRVIVLDRPYEESKDGEMKAYLSGLYCPSHPPYISVKKIMERCPGNRFEDQNSEEQELFQDYQFLHPDSEYELAVKLGPVSSAKEARMLANEWKKLTSEKFQEKCCLSSSRCCEGYCPQKNGEMMCIDTMIEVGKGIAKRKLGRQNYTKKLKNRASLQRLQQRFKGSLAWPGSPSPMKPHRRFPHDLNGEDDGVVRSLDFSETDD